MTIFGRRLETNFDGVTQPVPNQGLLNSVPMSSEDYVKEGWFDSCRFTTFPESGGGVLFSVTDVRGRSALTRLGTWKELWKHVDKHACSAGGVVTLRTVDTVHIVDLPYLRASEDVKY